MSMKERWQCPECGRSFLMPLGYGRARCADCMRGLSPLAVSESAIPVVNEPEPLRASAVKKAGMSSRTVVKWLLLLTFCAWPLATAGLAGWIFISLIQESTKAGENLYVVNGSAVSGEFLFLMNILSALCFTTPVAFFTLGLLGFVMLLTPKEPAP